MVEDFWDWSPPTRTALVRFVEESNMIEGILRPPTGDEVDAHDALLRQGYLTVDDLEGLVAVLQPDAVLRTQFGLDVRVADHVPPPGGYAVRGALTSLLFDASRLRRTCYEVGCEYQNLHPFTDGNGRSGRALWLWMMTRHTRRHPRGAYRAGVSFLHEWYYQSLAHHDAVVARNKREGI